jgi:hypothetical protein
VSIQEEQTGQSKLNPKIPLKTHGEGGWRSKLEPRSSRLLFAPHATDANHAHKFPPLPTASGGPRRIASLLPLLTLCLQYESSCGFVMMRCLSFRIDIDVGGSFRCCASARYSASEQVGERLGQVSTSTWKVIWKSWRTLKRGNWREDGGNIGVLGVQFRKDILGNTISLFSFRTPTSSLS